jgi:heme/copper-type cytochrome/quinol oxidase subunit 2
MAGPLADIAFWIAVMATAVAHAFILRSTLRSARVAGANRVWERVWAVLPALGVALLFVFTWRAMHPGSLTILMPANRVPPGGIGT